MPIKLLFDDYPGNEYVWASGQTIHCVYLYAKDADHAEKKAHDMIAEYKARLTDI